MAKEKIILDIQYLLMAKTGIRTYIHELLAATELSKKYEYVLYPKLAYIEKTNFFKKHTKWRHLFFHLHTLFWKQLVIPLLILWHRPKGVIFPDFHAPFWNLPCEKIIVFHDVFFWENSQNYNKWWLKYYLWSIIAGLNGKSKIISASLATEKKIIPLLKPKFIKTIYQSAPQFDKLTDVKPYEKLDHQPYILHVGVLEKRKNLGVLIKGFAIFLKTFPDYNLVLVGQKGPTKDLDDYENLQKLIHQLDLRANVLFTGYAAANQLKWLYENASVYTFPSVSEGFGIPVLEAFSYGLPVIVSEDGAINEIAGNGALSVPSLDPEAWSEAMKKLINSSNLRDDLIKNGKLRLKEFSKKNFLEGIENYIFRDQ
jgi:glycosyltransferase involved in cell wall biosynthesis